MKLIQLKLQKKKETEQLAFMHSDYGMFVQKPKEKIIYDGG